ncbi:MAG: TonB-dependent receptor [Phaeodactylibacter sp.]|nr:TonB-dependent receptor [Phaeodactylibacter sp.]MCB9265691.1 TonB-dependent receptor [Lewinellaceae bacterium]MCB9288395.1 TonB-dependent receptor [Lewinellaceae bacterium]
MKNFLRLIVALAAVLMLAVQAYAQGTVKGTATDENGEPLIGATILLVGTSRGTATDFDGNYVIENVPAGEHQFRASYTGYADLAQTATVLNGQETTLNFQLGEDVEVLEEVVVIGYGTARKEDATGVVAKITNEDFNKGAIVSPESLLAGKVAGVQITSNNGAPGEGTKVRIRGGTSVTASNEPLYVIDGIPIDNEGFAGGRNPLNFLNPSDIESFTVLKDASATAIYGSRGANGVIIITTKKGKAGSRPRINYEGYYTVNEIAGSPQLLDAQAFRDVVTYIAPARLEDLGNSSTNWFDEMLQTAKGQNHSLSMTGGAENIGYRLSAGYQKLEGIIRGSQTERISFSGNYNHKLFDDRLIINTNIRGAQTQDYFDPGIGAAWDFDPTQPVLDPDNTAFGGFFEYGNALAPRNPVSAIEQKENQGQTFRSIGNIDLEYKFDDFVPGLSFKTNLGYDVNKGEKTEFEPTTYINTQVANYNGRIKIENYTRTNYLLDAYLNYKKTLGQMHRLDIVAGYSYQDFHEEYPLFEGRGLSTDAFGVNNPGLAEEIFPDNDIWENRLISFFGRVNYNFDERYLLTATLRRDGSTRFGPENRWGLFPSAAFAWRILEEDFASGLKGVFSDLKLRLGYGVTGTESIGDYRYLPKYSFSDSRAQYQVGTAADGTPIFITTARPDPYDSGLKWEETSSYNAGLDFGFSNGRINGSVDYYYKNTKDLLFEVVVAAGTNLSDRVLTNIGELDNQGVELTLNGTIVNRPGLSWDLSGNIAYNINEVKAISNIAGSGILTGRISGGVGSDVQIIQVGSPVNSFYLYEHKLGADGLPLSDGIDHNEDGEANDLDIYVDRNGDGIINEDDRRVINSPAPDVIYGLTSNFGFKGFDLAFTLRGAVGNYVYNNNASNRGTYQRVQGTGIGNDRYVLYNLHSSVLESGFMTPQYFSDYYLSDASFLRLDNITLGYTFLPKSGLSSLRLYATAQNLFVLTKYGGLDPEVDNGIDNAPYPRPRGFIFGLSLGL